MNTEQALTQAIIAQPDDDLPRLALADWLEENGRAEQAELVRVQIALAPMAEDDERRPGLLSRETWLLARHSKELGRPLRGLAHRWEFRRGCVEGVTLPAGRFPSRAAELFARAPLRHLHLVGSEDHEALAACPQLAQVRGLTLTAAPTGYPNISRFHPLLGSPHLRGLRSLSLRSGTLRNEELHAIAAFPHLERLELRGCIYRIDARAAVPGSLAAPGSLPRLRSLSLSGWSGPVAWHSVLGRLDGLELRSHVGAQDVLYLLATASRTCRLGALLLASVLHGLDPAPLLSSGMLADLHTLQLRNCRLSGNDVAALVGERGPRRLVHLDLGSNPLGPRGAAALSSSSKLNHLTHLGLARVTQPGMVSQLVHSLWAAPLPRLAALDLQGNELTADDALELANSPLSAQLYWLDLRHNRLGDRGAQALLAADWPRLAWLDVSDNRLSSAAKAALRQRFGYSVHY
jgi:uncharacterized protein (TIGR02996 family)